MRLLDTCPMCHEDLPESIDKDLIEAKAFCPWCDYPLFWTVQPPDVPAAPANDAEIHATPATPQLEPDPAAWFRLPGVGGRESRTGDECWHCDEPNDQNATECRRCHVPIPEPDPLPRSTEPDTPAVAPAGVVMKRNPEVWAWVLVTLGIVLITLTAILIVKF